jgi:hypothetical protein
MFDALRLELGPVAISVASLTLGALATDIRGQVVAPSQRERLT